MQTKAEGMASAEQQTTRKSRHFRGLARMPKSSCSCKLATSGFCGRAFRTANVSRERLAACFSGIRALACRRRERHQSRFRPKLNCCCCYFVLSNFCCAPFCFEAESRSGFSSPLCQPGLTLCSYGNPGAGPSRQWGN